MACLFLIRFCELDYTLSPERCSAGNAVKRSKAKLQWKDNRPFGALLELTTLKSMLT